MFKCTHHWYLGSSHNGAAHAKCLKCGAEKDYPPVVISRFARVYRNKKVTLDPKPHGV